MKYVAKGLENHQMVVALSSHITESILHLHYDQIDEKNHKSLNSLLHVLEDSGYKDIADVMETQRHYIIIDNPLVAIKINDFINEHSAAVSSSLYYKGHANSQAVELIHKDFPKPKDESPISHRHIKLG
jgi:hypothetical protein